MCVILIRKEVILVSTRDRKRDESLNRQERLITQSQNRQEQAIKESQAHEKEALIVDFRINVTLQIGAVGNSAYRGAKVSIYF